MPLNESLSDRTVSSCSEEEHGSRAGNGLTLDSAIVGELNGYPRSPRQPAVLGPPPGLPPPPLSALDVSFLDSGRGGWQPGFKDEYSIFSHPSPFHHSTAPADDILGGGNEQDSAFSIIDDLSWTRPQNNSGRQTSFGFDHADDLGSSLFSEPFYGSSLSSGRGEGSVFSRRDTPSAWSQAISLTWSPLADPHPLGSSLFSDGSAEANLLGDSFFSNDGLFGFSGDPHLTNEDSIPEADPRRRESE